MIVVSDTSPLTALLKIGRADLLRLLFGEVIIPPAVHAELLHDHPVLPAWLEVRSPLHILPAVVAAHLDSGETQALSLALELHADTVLMDERLGRRVAKSLGLIPAGVLGCLVLAKQNGHLTTVSPVIAELQDIAGCWFDDTLITAIQRAAGEATQIPE